ncbi:hypothetical protein SNEBB_008182 [Seison nebaliae]|nr:hypothetical protein SNEBB_008182 [Seison nebaliae]
MVQSHSIEYHFSFFIRSFPNSYRHTMDKAHVLHDDLSLKASIPNEKVESFAERYNISQVSRIYYEGHEKWQEWIDDSDYRTDNFLLLKKDPTWTIILSTLYLIITFYGPKLMRKCQPLNVPKPLLVLYNGALTMLSLYMFVEIGLSAWAADYNWLCQPLNRVSTPGEQRMVNVLWWYFFSKLIEFMDTILMVVRKKENQITFLHYFHHYSMFLIWWCVMTWIPSGQSSFGAMINSFIHVIMYSYYALSSIPSMRKHLWWKKYITKAQLIQFVLTFCHTTHALVTGCNYPKWGLWLLSIYCLILFTLFSNFYIHAYRSKKAEEKKKILKKD